MLKVKKVTTKADAVRVVRDIRGEPIPFWLRPWNTSVAKEIRTRYIRGFEWVTDERGRRQKVELFDEDGYLDAMIDYIVASFEGVGDESGNPWPVDLAHKKELLDISVEQGGQPIWEWVIETAKNLAFIAAEEEVRDAEEQKKTL